MPKRLYDMLKLKSIGPFSLGVRPVNSSIKKPIGRINDVLIVVNDNYVPLIFLSWTLSMIPHVQLFWEDLFFAP